MNEIEKADIAVGLGEKLLGNHNYAYKGKNNNYYVHEDGENKRVTAKELADILRDYYINIYGVLPSNVAAFIVATVILNQGENNWIVDYGKIEEAFPSLENSGWKEDKEFVYLIVSDMDEYPQFKDGDASMIELTDDGFDCVAFTDYIACEPCDEE